MDDKLQNAARDVAGNVKESVGEATDDFELERRGEADQRTAGHLEERGSSAKEAGQA